MKLITKRSSTAPTGLDSLNAASPQAAAVLYVIATRDFEMSALEGEINGKYLDVSNYPMLAVKIPDKILEITEVIESNDIEKVRGSYRPYLDGIEADPAAVTFGDEMIFIGTGALNLDKVYYVDIEFGVFELHRTTKGFLDALQSK